MIQPGRWGQGWLDGGGWLGRGGDRPARDPIGIRLQGFEGQGRGGRTGGGGDRTSGHTQGHTKHSANAQARSHLKLAAVEGDQLPGDGQSQPRAAILPRRGAIGLLKGIENSAEAIARNPDPRIRHLDHQIALIRRLLFGQARGQGRTGTMAQPLGRSPRCIPQAIARRHPRRHRHRSLGGELNRIANQVIQNLLHPVLVRQHQGHIQGNVVHQRHRLPLHQRFRERQHHLRDFTHPHWPDLKRQLLMLQFREIQNIVDQTSQAPSTRRNHR